LPAVLNGRETWSLTLREEYRLKVFENRMLRRMFEPKKDEIIDSCKTLHNEKLRNLYFLTNIIEMIKSRSMRWAGKEALMGKKRNACSAFGGKARRKDTTRKTRGKWEYNITMDLTEIGCGGMEWIGMAQDRDQWGLL
jgi:hypothetical protein